VSRPWAFLRRVNALVRQGGIDRDLDQEIAAHLAEAEEEYVRRGLQPAHARRAALRDFGGITHTKERHRDVRSFVNVGSTPSRTSSSHPQATAPECFSPRSGTFS
jgi:hypothetical protein